MRRRLVLTIAAFQIALGGVAAAETLPCKQDPRIIQRCFAVHGRLSVHANMRPYLWPIGTGMATLASVGTTCRRSAFPRAAPRHWRRNMASGADSGREGLAAQLPAALPVMPQRRRRATRRIRSGIS